MRRPGITLLEVLAAIFIVGIGLLSLLTLFPLGALTMLRAVQDDRASQAGENAKAIADAVIMRTDFLVQQAMLNLNGAWGANAAAADGPGYLVLVDPIGVLAYTGQSNVPNGPPPLFNWPAWVGGYLPNQAAPALCSNVQRVQGAWLGVAPTIADRLRWCSLIDDIVFVSDGTYQGLASDPPAWVNPLTANVTRNLRYSYAWLCRMPRAGAPNVVNVTPLVFAGRSLDFVGFSSEEAVYNAQFLPQQNQIVITLAAGQTNPDLRRGQWILDSTTAVGATGQLSVHGFFYRIENVTIDPVTGLMTVEVQTPLRNWPDANIPTGIGTVVVLDNLLEVFEDGTF